MAWTQGKETTKEAIEAKLKIIGGDMLKIEYLENSLKQQLAFDVRKFVYMKVAEVYEMKLMFNEAAKNMDGAAEVSNTYKEKRENYIREAELWIKAVQYDRADEATGKALASSNTGEKADVKKRIKDFYAQKAKEFENMNKNNNAIKVYEKLVSYSFVPEEEKRQINQKLAKLYARVGKVQDAMRLEGK